MALLLGGDVVCFGGFLDSGTDDSEAGTETGPAASPKKRAAPESAPAESPRTAAATLTPAAPSDLPRAPEPRKVVLRIESVPSDADVTDLSTGARLGATPHELEVPAGSARPWLRTSRDGYADAEFRVPTDSSDTTVVKLRRKAAAKTPKTTAPPRASAGRIEESTDPWLEGAPDEILIRPL